MTCINDDIIQKYIDGEASQKEVTLIENHIATCNDCTKSIEKQRILSASLKKAINILSKDNIVVPKFKIPTKSYKNHYLQPKRLYYIIAAACILVFVIFITQKEELKNDDIVIEIGSVMEVDANRPVSQFPLVISIIDSKGNISEQIIN